MERRDRWRHACVWDWQDWPVLACTNRSEDGTYGPGSSVSLVIVRTSKLGGFHAGAEALDAVSCGSEPRPHWQAVGIRCGSNW